MALDSRKKRILEAVIEQFIDTGSPVGSKYVASAMDNTVSSATIRNDMAALEAAGFTLLDRAESADWAAFTARLDANR